MAHLAVESSHPMSPKTDTENVPAVVLFVGGGAVLNENTSVQPPLGEPAFRFGCEPPFQMVSFRPA